MNVRARTSLPDRGEEILDLLRAVNRGFRDVMFERAHQPGLPALTPRLFVLREIRDQPGVTMNALARRLGMQKSGVSILVGKLEKEGHVRKGPDPRDRRLVRLHVTRSGLRDLARWTETYRTILRRTLDAMSSEEVEQLSSGLAALLRALSPNVEPDRAPR